MLGMNTPIRLGLALAGRLPPRMRRSINNRFAPPTSFGSGISMSLNKRLSSERTRQLTGWKPSQRDILNDIEHGSYAT
jgi:hypothetical protein